MKAIAAMARNRVIGRAGKMPWHLPDDFRWFKQVTMGHVLLMGRKTFESIGRPLPGRETVVVSRRGPIDIAGVITIPTLATFRPEDYAPREVWVAGGAELYRQMLPRCSDLYLTQLYRDAEGDVSFPEFENGFDFVETIKRHTEFEVLHFRNRAMEAE